MNHPIATLLPGQVVRVDSPAPGVPTLPMTPCMRMTRFIRRTGLALLSACPCLGFADKVTLEDGAARLSGRVRAIDAAGALELESPLSPEPLRIKPGQFRKAEFDAAGEASAATGTLLELANGDVLPVEVESFDDRVLVARSPVAGRLEVPRAAMGTLQLGVGLPRTVFRGPGPADGWLGGSDDLRIDDEGMVSTGLTSAAREIGLPECFVLRFTLTWQLRQTPSFLVFFADPLKPKGERSDRYRFVFNSGGIEIKRLSATGNQHRSLLQLNRRPDQYPQRELKVEIRVDRKASRLQLFLNGEPENPVADPLQPPPSGSGLVFECNASERSPHTVRDIEVLELQEAGVRHRSEDRGEDLTKDSLVSRDEDRWTGRLLGIRKAETGLVYRFQGEGEEQPLEIPAEEVSTVFLASGGPADAAPAATPFVLRLRGDGRLRVRSCAFDAASASVSHPLLGELRLDRGNILALERIVPRPAPDQEGEE